MSDDYDTYNDGKHRWVNRDEFEAYLAEDRSDMTKAEARRLITEMVTGGALVSKVFNNDEYVALDSIERVIDWRTVVA